MRQPVAREHQLPAGLVQRVERVKELLLGLRLTGKELDVIDQQDVGVAICLLEVVQRARAECREEMVGESLGGGVADDRAGAEVAYVVADRVQEMGFSQPGRGMEEERVVCLPWQLRHRQRSRVS